MLSNHVEAELFQKLQIRNHGLSVRRRVQAIRPKSLIEGSELEHKLPVQQWPGDVLNFTFGNSSEARVALYLIPAVKRYS